MLNLMLDQVCFHIIRLGAALVQILPKRIAEGIFLAHLGFIEVVNIIREEKQERLNQRKRATTTC